jgi:hypothetical protein
VYLQIPKGAANLTSPAIPLEHLDPEFFVFIR